jgi:endonuclease/exonuclease/phosphatase family metal-dependent hydrolase
MRDMAASAGLTVATWNTQWATTTTERGSRVAAKLRSTDADIIVVTEGVRALLPAGGHVHDAGADWGYTPKPERRKVIVWSRLPLTLETVGAEGATHGRLAVVTASTTAGAVRIIGVCIPWRDAHVSTGRSDASPWSEHLEYLDKLEELFKTIDLSIPTIIAGDFNQRVPRVSQPIRVADRLAAVLDGWTTHTAGSLPHGPHIDHIATNAHLFCRSTTDWPGADAGVRLSDHSGVCCRFDQA